MPNYLYNGVELPALPEYDTTAYPYAVIIQRATKSYVFVPHSTKHGAGTDRIFYYSGLYYFVSSDGLSWVENDTGVAADYGIIKWANYDVLNSDGSVYLSASTPVLATPSDQPYLAASDPIPVMDYNGTRLPPLPDYDATTYPYAFIYYYSDIKSYYLVLGQSIPVFNPDSWTDKVSSWVQFPSGETVEFTCSADTWSALGKTHTDGGNYPVDDIPYVWTNVDIINVVDNSTFLSASTPTPASTYPYSVIALNYEKGQDDWYQAKLYYSATPFLWNGTAVVNSGTTYKRIYDATYVTGYKYNGVELPDINSVWTDKETYPYALIYSAGEEGHLLILSTQLIYGDSSGAGSYSGSWLMYACDSGGANWTSLGNVGTSVEGGDAVWCNSDVLTEENGTLYLATSTPIPVGAWTPAIEVPVIPPLTLTPGLDGNVYTRIWTNHDIVDGTGAVWLAADNVTPAGVSEEWLRSFKMGLALGLYDKTLVFGKRLVGYSYNGTVLPKLPEWDKETYPYAYIIDDDINYNAYFLVYAAAEQNALLGDLNFIPYLKSVRYKFSDGSWVSVGIADGAGGKVIWCNTDVYYSENTANGNLAGTLYLSAAEPIPIYE